MTWLNEIASEYNKATKLLNQGKADKALRLFKKILSRYEFKEALTNSGNCHRILGNKSEMFRCYNRALANDVPYLDKGSDTELHALNNLGLAHFMYGDDDTAIDCYKRAIARKPDFWEAWWNCSTATLRKASSGETALFPRGWEMYKARFLKSSPIRLKNLRPDLLYWDTISSGDSIVVLAEQGIGDNIMFGRFVPLLFSKFKNVYVQCDPSIACFFEHIGCKTVWDPSEIPGECVAYPMCNLGECFPLSDARADWLHDFGSGTNVGGIGVVWSGSATHANNLHRSVDNVNRFRDINSVLVSLNPGARVPPWMVDAGVRSWTETACWLRSLDMLISVDTSVAHLAASMGIETWLLQPWLETDFRWGRAFASTDVDVPATTTSVWYPSVRVFSNPQSWDFVFKNIKKELNERNSQR